jgi:hypothetical protein
MAAEAAKAIVVCKDGTNFEVQERYATCLSYRQKADTDPDAKGVATYTKADGARVGIVPTEISRFEELKA